MKFGAWALEKKCWQTTRVSCKRRKGKRKRDERSILASNILRVKFAVQKVTPRRHARQRPATFGKVLEGL